MKSPQAFNGYFRNPEATAAAVVDGWYRTGDLVERDDEGYVWVVGRAKDMIRTGGETVAPAEVEVVLQRHPPFATPPWPGSPTSTGARSSPRSWSSDPDHSVDLAEVRAPLRRLLGRLQAPSALGLPIDAIPRTGPTGQVQRRLLVELAQAAVAMGGGP